MKINRKVLAGCLALAVFLSFLPIFKALATDDNMSDQQIIQIRSSCSSAKATLNQLHTSDALLRVNMGQIYESMQTKLMDRFNSRAGSSGYAVSDLAAVTSKYEAILDTFRSDYKKYEEQLAASLSIDCSKQPVAFYDAVLLARADREQVYDDVMKLNSYIDQYQSAIKQFESDFQAARKGDTGR